MASLSGESASCEGKSLPCESWHDTQVSPPSFAQRLAENGTVEQMRFVLGAVASRPLAADRAAQQLVGGRLDDDAIARAAASAAKLAKPMDNTDFTLHWRKRVATAFVTYALREVRGDDMRSERRTVTRWDPAGLASNGRA